MYKSTPLFKVFRFNVKVWVKFPRKLTLSSEELTFRRYDSTEYAKQISKDCHTMVFNRWHFVATFVPYYLLLLCKRTIRCHLKLNIFNSDKAERYDGQRKHQARFRLSTGINRKFKRSLLNGSTAYIKHTSYGLNFVRSSIIYHLRL